MALRDACIVVAIRGLTRMRLSLSHAVSRQEHVSEVVEAWLIKTKNRLYPIRTDACGFANLPGLQQRPGRA